MMATLRAEPTLKDIATAVKFMAERNGNAKHAEDLAWLISITREEERRNVLGEDEAIQQVLRIGHRYGFGNLISRLSAEWQKVLGPKLAGGAFECIAVTEARVRAEYEPLIQAAKRLHGSDHASLGALFREHWEALELVAPDTSSTEGKETNG